MNTTMEMIRTIMASVDNELVYEDANTLEYDNSFGEDIVFVFENNILIKIFS